MSSLRFSALLLLLLTGVAGCESAPLPHPAPTGAMHLAVGLSLAVPDEVSRVTVTVSGPDMAPRSADLTLAQGAWGGVLDDLPAGEHRTFLAQAFDAASTPRYEGRAEDVTITAGSTGVVSLRLQEVALPSPFVNEAPRVSALVASSSAVPTSGTLSLSVSAHDSDPGDSVSYAWTAPTGSFSAPTQARTTWTALQAPRERQGPHSRQDRFWTASLLQKKKL